MYKYWASTFEGIFNVNMTQLSEKALVQLLEMVASDFPSEITIKDGEYSTILSGIAIVASYLKIFIIKFLIIAVLYYIENDKDADEMVSKVRRIVNNANQ